MELFKDYLRHQIECYDAFHRWKFFSKEKPALVGAVLLDSICYPLYEYIDVLLSTDPNSDFADKPIDYLNQIAVRLKLISNPKKQRRNTILGNPLVNSLDFYQLFGLAPLWEDEEDEDEDKEDKEDAKGAHLSQAKVALKRKVGLYNFLQMVSSILDIIAKGISGNSEAKIKAVFLLYALDRKCNILKNHLISSWSSNDFIYADLYRESEDIDVLQCTSNSKIEYVANIMTTRIAQFIIDNRIDDSWGVIESLLESASKVQEIRALINKDIFTNQFIQFSESFKEKYLKTEDTKEPYPGLMTFFSDLASDKIKSSIKDDESYMKIKNKMSKLRNNHTFFIDTRSNVAMNNPFPISGWNYGRDSIDGCPLHLYTMPLMNLFDSLAAIEKELDAYAQGKKDGKDCDILYENMLELCAPFLDLLKKEYKHLKKMQYSLIIYEAVKIEMGKCNTNKFSLRTKTLYERFGNSILSIIKQIVKKEISNKRIRKKAGHNSVSREKSLSAILDSKFIHFVLLQAKEITSWEDDSKELDSVYCSFKCACIQRKYEYLRSELLGKTIKEVFDNKYCINGENCLINSVKPFPYVEKRTIDEWREYFNTFCNLSEKENVRFLLCEQGNHKLCKERFIRHLRDVYIQEFIHCFSV